LGVPPETRREYIPVGSVKNVLFFKVSGGTPNYRRIVSDLYSSSFEGERAKWIPVQARDDENQGMVFNLEV
jgi:hypothetical protein